MIPAPMTQYYYSFTIYIPFHGCNIFGRLKVKYSNGPTHRQEVLQYLEQPGPQPANLFASYVIYLIAIRYTISTMRLLIIFFFITQAASAQKKWTSISGNDIFIFSLMTVSGAADGVNQAIIHHELGRGRQFWDYAISWKNKYKDFDNGDKRAAFFGSKSILVGFTDAFHLTRMIDKGCTLTAISVSAFQLKDYKKKDRWKVVAKKLVISTLLNRLAFILMYNNLEGPF